MGRTSIRWNTIPTSGDARRQRRSRRTVPEQRRYSTALRAEQTALTRRRILDAAGRLLVERGYHGTTLNGVADAAEVSVQTVYNVVGGKAALLKAVYDVTLAGDDEPVPITERPEFRAAVEATDRPRVPGPLRRSGAGPRRTDHPPAHRAAGPGRSRRRRPRGVRRDHRGRARHRHPQRRHVRRPALRAPRRARRRRGRGRPLGTHRARPDRPPRRAPRLGLGPVRDLAGRDDGRRPAGAGRARARRGRRRRPSSRQVDAGWTWRRRGRRGPGEALPPRLHPVPQLRRTQHRELRPHRAERQQRPVQRVRRHPQAAAPVVDLLDVHPPADPLADRRRRRLDQRLDLVVPRRVPRCPRGRTPPRRRPAARAGGTGRPVARGLGSRSRRKLRQSVPLRSYATRYQRRPATPAGAARRAAPSLAVRARRSRNAAARRPGRPARRR